MPEILNIEVNTVLVILKALNKYKLTDEAADALGIDMKTLKKKIWQYEIKVEEGNYVSRRKLIA